MMGYGWFGPMGGLGMVFWLFFWVALIALLVWGATALISQRAPRNEATPAEILKRRYARGEITEAEYDEAKRALV